jgi:hypothetical protein
LGNQTAGRVVIHDHAATSLSKKSLATNRRLSNGRNRNE